MLSELLVVATFVAVHVLIDRLRFLDVIPRSQWLSIASGVSVAYVFVHVLPMLGEASHALGAGRPAAAPQHPGYLLALLGLAVFYSLERQLKAAVRGGGHGGAAGSRIYHVHTAAFAAYNVLVGYLLVHRAAGDTASLPFYAAALGLHFVVVDHGLYQHHRHLYLRRTRWVLALALAGGWLLGLSLALGPGLTGGAFAFLAGGILLNVLKEELPEERQSRVLPFLLGGIACTVLLLLA